MQALEDRPVFERDHFYAEGARLCAHAHHFLVERRFETGDTDRTLPGNVDQRSERVRAVIERTHCIAPVVGIGVCQSCPTRLAIVHIFALTVFERAEPAFFKELAHLFRGAHKAVVFGVHILHTGRLDGLDQFDRLFHRLDREHFAQYVLARPHRFDRERRVLVREIRKHNEIHIVFDEFVEIGIKRDGVAVDLRPVVQLLCVFVADRDQLGIACLETVIHHGTASARTEHADADLPVGLVRVYRLIRRTVLIEHVERFDLPIAHKRLPALLHAVVVLDRLESRGEVAAHCGGTALSGRQLEDLHAALFHLFHNNIT